MTKEELIKDGWEPKECKIDTLYFKGNYFIHLKDAKALVYSVSDDMNPIGETDTIDGIKTVRKLYDRAIIKAKEKHLRELKKIFELIYGEKV